MINIQNDSGSKLSESLDFRAEVNIKPSTLQMKTLRPSEMK